MKRKANNFTPFNVESSSIQSSLPKSGNLSVSSFLDVLAELKTYPDLNTPVTRKLRIV